jgi:hypothetical protein
VIRSGTLDETVYFTINKHKISGFHIEANDSSGALVDAINSAYEETGVLAKLDANSQLVLTAEDGRNIEIGKSPLDLGNDYQFITGLTEGVYGGQLTLQSNEGFEAVFGSNNVNDSLGQIRRDTPPQTGSGVAIFGTSTEFSVNDVDITSREGANVSLDIIDLALEQISS